MTIIENSILLILPLLGLYSVIGVNHFDVLEGGRVNFSCPLLLILENSSFIWQFNGGEILSNCSEDNFQLSICSVSQRDAGNYTCSNGTKTEMFLLSVCNYSLPKLEHHFVNASVIALNWAIEQYDCKDVDSSVVYQLFLNSTFSQNLNRNDSTIIVSDLMPSTGYAITVVGGRRQSLPLHVKTLSRCNHCVSGSESSVCQLKNLSYKVWHDRVTFFLEFSIDSCITSVDFKYQKIGENNSRQLNESKQDHQMNLTLRNLSPSTNYFFVIQPVLHNDTVHNESMKTVNLTTKESLPKIKSINSTTLFIPWRTDRNVGLIVILFNASDGNDAANVSKSIFISVQSCSYHMSVRWSSSLDNFIWKQVSVIKANFSDVNLLVNASAEPFRPSCWVDNSYQKPCSFNQYLSYDYNATVTLFYEVEPPREWGEDDQPFPPAVLIGVIVALLFLVVLVLAFIFVRTYLLSRYNPVPQLGPVPVPVSPTALEVKAILSENWEEHVTQLHADGDYGFSQEYFSIEGNIQFSSAKHSSDPENKNKNRYINVVAYDSSRVVLKQLVGKSKHSDYINANFVDGYQKMDAYIAAQGPLPATFDDFWRMVWEQKSNVICMITNLMEKGRRKCDQYWPNEGEQMYGQIAVRLLNSYSLAHYCIRIFSLRNIKIKKRNDRVVMHYHYTDWPDHGVPDYSLPVLQYVQRSAAQALSNDGPIIVHCSAGVGRTGTYIVLDTMMRQIEDKGCLNVYGFLSHIRSQRNLLVQTEEQYVFIHDALLEYIQNGGSTVVPADKITAYVQWLDKEPENLNKQWKLISDFEVKPYYFTATNLPANKFKNREGSILPVDPSRVVLPMIAGQEGSDYINASFLQGYNHHDEFIVTQHPMENTLEDFWRMVWDRNSVSIVILSDALDEDLISIIPSNNMEKQDYGSFTLTISEKGVNTTSLLLQSMQDDYECSLTVFFYRGWPSTQQKMDGVLAIISGVKSWQRSHPEAPGPIVLVDNYGGRSAALFAALATIQDQLHHDECIDIYLTCKLYQQKRPNMITEQVDYRFLYEAANHMLLSQPSLAHRQSNGIVIAATLPGPRHVIIDEDSQSTRVGSTL